MRTGLAALGAALAPVVAAGCDAAVAPAGPEAGRSSGPGAPSAPDDAGWFRDATSEWGVDFVHDAGFTDEKHLPETMGGGAAIADFDADGDLDLYFVQSGPMPVGAAGRRTAAMPPNRMLANDGGGRFRDRTDAIGDAAHTGYGMGCAAGDLDGDASLDLWVTNFGPDAVLVQTGGLVFEERSENGVDDERWTAGATLFDPDADGDLDAYVTAYVAIDVEHPAWCGRREPGWRSYCHPDHYPGIQDRFWRNDGDARFANATEEAGLADSFGKGLGAVAVDMDADGWLDLYVANDSVENRLWRNRADGTFEDATLLSGTGVDRDGRTEAGMGLAAGDVDGDLLPELFVTNFDDESNTLYRNDGEGLFTDATARLGLEAPSRLPVGFGTVLEDFDLDGDLDLAVANGHIIDNIELYHDGKTWKQEAQLYENLGGTFRESVESAGDLGGRPFVGRGLYSGDLDGDGRADLVLTQCGGPAVVLRNRTPERDAVVLRDSAWGATLIATRASGERLARSTQPAPSYFGQCAPELALAVPSERDAIVEILVRANGGAETTFAFDPPLRRSVGSVVRDAAGTIELRGLAPAGAGR